MHFEISSTMKPSGDQPKAIKELVGALKTNTESHVLMGVTGSGKTFTVAHVVSQLKRSALVIAPNKTLAAQLYSEFRNLFTHNCVGLFISYYDYYQPEAYIAASDKYIAKDSSINDDIDKMRHKSTKMLFEEKNCIIVASVSCIYGLGSPSAYSKKTLHLKINQKLSRKQIIHCLQELHYERSDNDLKRGSLRVRGNQVDILPSHSKTEIIRTEFDIDTLSNISLINKKNGKKIRQLKHIYIYPNTHYLAEEKTPKEIIKEIEEDLKKETSILAQQGKTLEAQRLNKRVSEDLESIKELGYCPGIENYSRYLSGKNPGEPPYCLLDYFPKNYLTIIDESHLGIPQIAGMYQGDRARKENLVKFGFRLRSALDNRPLNFKEFLQKTGQTLYVSATPGKFEKNLKECKVTEQIIRPTGLIDPPINIIKVKNQITNLYMHLKETIKTKGRCLIITLTKKMSEDLASYYQKYNLKIKYMHSDIDALERTYILRDFRYGKFDILIGINLLREGLDLPEVKLVAVLDADKEGFLRSKTSLIQIIGRAARNQDSKVILYANKISNAMSKAIEETDRRRKIQQQHNNKFKITPKTIQKTIPDDLRVLHGIGEYTKKDNLEPDFELLNELKINSLKQLNKSLVKLRKKMQTAAKKLDFETAAIQRDQIKKLECLSLAFGGRENNVSSSKK
jgi:excinuclease ABC subunit B